MAMMVNTAWLLEYLEPKCSHEDLVAALPEVGLELEQHLDLNAHLRDSDWFRARENAAGRCAGNVPVSD